MVLSAPSSPIRVRKLSDPDVGFLQKTSTDSDSFGFLRQTSTASQSFVRQCTPDQSSGICDTVVLALQLPEAQGETGLDEVSQAALRLRRAGDCLFQQPQIEVKTAPVWTLEDESPTLKDLGIASDFLTFIMKFNTNLEDAYEKLCLRSAGLTVFMLRNGLGVLAALPGSQAGAGGSVWPEDLPSAEKLFAVMCTLFRVDDGGIPRGKFVQFKKWIEAENSINELVGRRTMFDSSMGHPSGSRLRRIVSSSVPSSDSSQVLEQLNALEILLDLETKASTHVLLLDKGGSLLPTVIDMVLCQGVECLENKSVTRLWSLCQRLVQEAVAIGCPRAASRSNSRTATSTPRGKGVVADVHARRLTRSNSSNDAPGSARRMLSARQSSKSSVDQPLSPPEAKVSARQSSKSSVDQPLSPPDTKSPEAKAVPAEKSLATSQSAPCLPKLAPLPEKTIMRKCLVRKKPTGSLPELGAETLSQAEPPAATQRVLTRRHSISSSVPAQELAQPISPSAQPISPSTQEKESRIVANSEWELNCCAILWEAMPPQSVTYAIGVGMHSVQKTADLKRLLQGAWTLLDKARAVDYLIGSIGIGRLRMQMDMLKDQFSSSLTLCGMSPKVGKRDEKEMTQFFGKARLNFVHLCIICGADVRFSQVAALYGVSFIVERMCKVCEYMLGSEEMTSAGRQLIEALSPHLTSLFQTRVKD